VKATVGCLLTSHHSPPTAVLRAIFLRHTAQATGLILLMSCGSSGTAAPTTPAPTTSRVLPLARVIVLETAGPPPSDTSVTFTAGTSRIIVLRHGPPENIVFARVSFAAAAFADSGQSVTVEIRPRPGVYGLELSTTVPFREGVTVEFDYARYFSPPARAIQVYSTAAAFEEALAVGRLLPNNQVELLPTANGELDQAVAAIAGPGSYLVAAPL
jgi:hypothetical protein